MQGKDTGLGSGDRKVPRTHWMLLTLHKGKARRRGSLLGVVWGGISGPDGPGATVASAPHPGCQAVAGAAPSVTDARFSNADLLGQVTR